MSKKLLSIQQILYYEVCAHLSGHTASTQLESADLVHEVTYPNFSDVKAQSMSKRALEISAGRLASLCAVRQVQVKVCWLHVL